MGRHYPIRFTKNNNHNSRPRHLPYEKRSKWRDLDGEHARWETNSCTSSSFSTTNNGDHSYLMNNNEFDSNRQRQSVVWFPEDENEDEDEYGECSREFNNSKPGDRRRAEITRNTTFYKLAGFRERKLANSQIRNPSKFHPRIVFDLPQKDKRSFGSSPASRGSYSLSVKLQSEEHASTLYEKSSAPHSPYLEDESDLMLLDDVSFDSESSKLTVEHDVPSSERFDKYSNEERTRSNLVFKEPLKFCNNIASEKELAFKMKTLSGDVSEQRYGKSYYISAENSMQNMSAKTIKNEIKNDDSEKELKENLNAKSAVSDKPIKMEVPEPEGDFESIPTFPDIPTSAPTKQPAINPTMTERSCFPETPINENSRHSHSGVSPLLNSTHTTNTKPSIKANSNLAPNGLPSTPQTMNNHHNVQRYNEILTRLRELGVLLPNLKREYDVHMKLFCSDPSNANLAPNQKIHPAILTKELLFSYLLEKMNLEIEFDGLKERLQNDSHVEIKRGPRMPSSRRKNRDNNIRKQFSDSRECNYDERKTTSYMPTSSKFSRRN